MNEELPDPSGWLTREEPVFLPALDVDERDHWTYRLDLVIKVKS
jgi:hypothetical protein